MLRTDINHQLLHLCRQKRYALTKAQIATKAITRATHAPGNSLDSPVAAAQGAQHRQAADITALHIIEAELRGLKPSHKEPGWSVLYSYRLTPRPLFDAWVAAT